MPTGYTYRIEEGCTFEEFIWACARAFGACIEMREDPMDKPVPDEFQPSPYYRQRIEETEKKLAQLDAMTTAEIEAAIRAEREEAIAENARYAAENEEKQARYDAILEMVRAWEPPSEDHDGLKKFMLEQIEISLPGKPYQQDLPCEDPAAWLAERKQNAREDLANHHKHYAEEVERTNSRNDWIRKLRASVPQPKNPR